jgi:Peptidase A4 family
MSRRSLLSPPLFALAAFVLSLAAPAQDTAYGKWVTDPKNLATPVFVYAQPPATFNPLTSSDAEIARYGLPPRPDPSQTGRYAHWKKMATAQRVTQGLIVTKPSSSQSLGCQPTRRSYIESCANLIWSGYALGVEAGTFADNNNSMAYGGWLVPSVRQGACNASTTDYATQWVGFDGLSAVTGTGSSDILQAGTEEEAACGVHGRPAGSTYFAWIAWSPYVEVQTPTSFLHVGDAVQVSVWYTAGAPYSSASMYVYNETTDRVFTGSVNLVSEPAPYMGDSVEWILERPCPEGETCPPYPNLPNFGTVTMNDVYAENSSGVTYAPGDRIRGVTDYEITMVCDSSNWIPATACPGQIDISTFNLTTGRRGTNALSFTASPPAAP